MKQSFAKCLTVVVLVAGAFSTPSALAAASQGAPKSLDACSLITKADVNAAFAPRIFEVDNSGPVQRLSTKYAEVSNCTFVSKGATIRDLATVTVSVRVATSDEYGVGIDKMKAGAVALKGTPVDIAGVGDGAYWVNLGSSARPVRQLAVAKGKRLWLTFGEGSPALSDAEAVERLTRLAKFGLGKR